MEAKSKLINIVFSLLLILYFSSFFIVKINPTNSDVGRHIKNGEVLLTQGIIPHTNFYSYTEPDFTVIMHHWLSGVLYYIVYFFSGFNGLTYFNALLFGLYIFAVYKASQRYASSHIAFFSVLMMLPFLTSRKEVRPEVFSYVFVMLYFILLDNYRLGKVTLKRLLLLTIPIQVFWVNLHIFFILGIFLPGLFALNELLFNRKSKSYYQYIYVSAALFLVSFLNPSFAAGALEPFNIFKEFAFTVVELSPMLHLQKVLPDFVFICVEVYAGILLLLTCIVIYKKKLSRYFILLVLNYCFLVLSFKAIRGIPLLGLFSAPFLAMFINDFLPREKTVFNIFNIIMTVVSLEALTLSNVGVGLYPGVLDSANFYKQNNLKGPIFNNFDIGSYLIFNFYGKEPVFVDNRPEAYSAAFFNDLYKPMQHDKAKWLAALEEYQFNVIYFNKNDISLRGRTFLTTRSKDPDWVTVYIDQYAIIMVRNNAQNRDLIDKYALYDVYVPSIPLE